MKIQWLVSIVVLLGIGNASAQLHTEVVNYNHGDTALKGYLAYDTAQQGKRPGVLVVHDWMGLNDFARSKAEQLAKLGYIALAVDMYGNGQVAKNPKEAATLAGRVKGDRQLMRQRVAAALTTLKDQALTDSNRTAAIGYCFGGTTVLELARSGAEVAGVVSFHGGLDTPDPADAKNIKAKVLVLHGADDPHAPAEQVAVFQDEMRKAGVDWQMISYGGAVHSFTNPNSGSDNSKGVAYNERADKRSWKAMKSFLEEIFR